METVNQEEVKTFTQEEVDAIVGDRLKRERAKYADYDALTEKAGKYDAEQSELQKVIEVRDSLQAEIDGMKAAEALRLMREKVSQETGIPAHLLTGSTEDECKAQAEAISDFAKPKTYPAVRDGGEVVNVGKKTTRQQFADWANEAFG